MNPLAPATSAPSTASAPSTGTGTLPSDFNTFLTMLTTQLQNQDPLNPADSSEFAVQLATFSSVEQQVLTNQLLADLSTAMATTGLAELAGWVGQEVRAPTAIWFDGSPVTVAPNPAATADRAELVVTDSTGAEVQRMEIPVSAEPLSWAGVGPDGTPMPPGQYTFTVESHAGGELVLSETADVYATVTEVRTEDGVLILVVEGGATVPVDQVSAVRPG